MTARALANCLSASRIVLTPFFLYFMTWFFQHRPGYFTLAIITYCIICLTDILDGKIARCHKAESKFGQKLDILADAIFILSSAAFLTLWHLLPLWVGPIIFLKLLEFTITSRRLSQNHTPIFDLPGRVGAVLFYILPIWVFLFKDIGFMIPLFLALTLLMTLISSSLRTLSCMGMAPEINPAFRPAWHAEVSLFSIKSRN